MTGSLQKKGKKYYVAINYKDANGKSQMKWVSTGVEWAGNNIRKAKKVMEDILEQNKDLELVTGDNDLFSHYVKAWLETEKHQIDSITYQGYEQYATKHIIPYFDALGLRIRDITTQVIQKYCNEKLDHGRLDGKGGLSAKSIRRHHVVIQQVLKTSVRNNVITSNPASLVVLPKTERFEASFYNSDEVNQLLNVCHQEPLKPLILLTVYYGLRRSEVLGLQWDAIDFINKKVSIKRTVVKMGTLVEKEKTKNLSSKRSYPLLPVVEMQLKSLKAKEQQNRELFGNTYNENDYVFKWDDGRPFAPEYVSQGFKRIIDNNKLRHIRFHDLRHSCASILIDMGYTLKDIQEWLGHADISMTANVYGHLDAKRKTAMAQDFANVIMA